jgi:hypothetical protein
MNKFVVLLLVGLFICSGCHTGLVESNFTIKVSGTSGLEFSGHYMTVTAGGVSTLKSVEGKVPDQYSVRGSIVSCTFQKKTKRGILSIQIIKDGKVVSASETNVAYGYGAVSAATQ